MWYVEGSQIRYPRLTSNYGKAPRDRESCEEREYTRLIKIQSVTVLAEDLLLYGLSRGYTSYVCAESGKLSAESSWRGA